MNILAIDCGIDTGYATLVNGVIRSGVEHMKGKNSESAGMKYLRFDAWLNLMHTMNHIDLIVYEKPFHLQGHAIEVLNGFITGILRYCAAKEIQYKAYTPSEIKMFATGKKGAKKEQMMAWFKAQEGRDPATDDEADAMATLKLAMQEFRVMA